MGPASPRDHHSPRQSNSRRALPLRPFDNRGTPRQSRPGLPLLRFGSLWPVLLPHLSRQLPTVRLCSDLTPRPSRSAVPEQIGKRQSKVRVNISSFSLLHSAQKRSISGPRLRACDTSARPIRARLAKGQLTGEATLLCLLICGRHPNMRQYP